MKKKLPEDVLYEVDDQWYPDFHLKVLGIGDRKGRLAVTFKGKEIYFEYVSLSYGAVFGPDIMDIDYWSHVACNIVDKYRKELNDGDYRKSDKCPQ